MSKEKHNKVNTDINVPWRNNNGEIVCSKEQCTLEENHCEENCPIFLQTIAQEFWQLNLLENAIQTQKKAVEIAPDFAEAWQNLASFYGSISNYENALICYEKAYKLAPDKKGIVFGLAIAHRDLNHYEECLKWCDRYDSIADDHKLDQTRAYAENALGLNKTNTDISSVDFWERLLAQGKEDGYITSDTLPFVIELQMQRKYMAERVIKAVYEYEFNDNIDKAICAFCFCAYAGIGAAAHWHYDWNTLSQNDIYETLTKERGIFAMDEYVTDYIGIGWDTEESNALIEHLKNQVYNLLAFSYQNPSIIRKTPWFIGCCMFDYGVALELNRLGFK